MIGHIIELNEENEARKQIGALEAVQGEDRTDEKNKASRTDMEEPVNAVTSIARNLNLPRFDGTKPENYRDWCSKARVILSLSNQNVFSVLNGVAEPILIFPNIDPRTSR